VDAQGHAVIFRAGIILVIHGIFRSFTGDFIRKTIQQVFPPEFVHGFLRRNMQSFRVFLLHTGGPRKRFGRSSSPFRISAGSFFARHAATPHIHERHVFDCENRYGELCPQQEKALEELGVPLPKPDKRKGRNNNRKQTFDAICRTLLFDICRRHGLHLDQEPSYGGRDYLEKQDYILMKQKEQLAAQEQKLEELTLKIEDVETLLDDVSDVAYDKAVEVVTDTVRQETHKEDIRLIEDTKKWVLSPERKAPKKERDYAAARLDGVITKIKNAMQHALAKIQRTLMQPEVKQAGKEQIKKKAKESIMDKLAKAKINTARENRERWEREGRIASTKKQDMEL